ncbi:MAG: LytTR family DNA-binding domain-containing protein [bacterium]|nr:LytTR family DNA-binding domain-containing protein [bacterium]
MKTYSVLIVEDEYPARELLIQYLMTRPELQLKGMARDGAEAAEAMTAGEFDIVFLDINLPVQSGLAALENVGSQGEAARQPHVIFTTAYKEHALAAFDHQAIDYLLKPFTLERFQQAVDRALVFLKSGESDESPLKRHGIFVSENDRHCFVPYEKILYLSSHGKQTVVHTPGVDFRTPRLLKKMESVLPETSFARIHKQFIVNVFQIDRLEYFMNGSYMLHLKDDDESLPVSRTYAPKLKERFGL